MLIGVRPGPPTPSLEGPGGTIGPSFLILGHINISRVLDRSRSLICVVSRGKLGAQTGAMMLMMLALGGCRALKKCARNLKKRSKYTLRAVFVAVN